MFASVVLLVGSCQDSRAAAVVELQVRLLLHGKNTLEHRSHHCDAPLLLLALRAGLALYA